MEKETREKERKRQDAADTESQHDRGKRMSNQSKVAEFIASRQLLMGMTNKDVAEEVGYANPNVISMIKKGQTKLPVEKVAKMAEALGADPAKLLRMALKEYMPETLKVMEACMGNIVTQNEMAMIEIWRDATNGEDPEIPAEAVYGLRQGFVTIMENAKR